MKARRDRLLELEAEMLELPVVEGDGSQLSTMLPSGTVEYGKNIL